MVTRICSAAATACTALWMIAAIPASAQRMLPDTAWQRLAQADDYWYASSVEGRKPVARNRGGTIADIIQFFASSTGKVILVIFLIAVVAYIVYRIAGAEGFFHRRSKKITPPGEEDDLSPEDLEQGLWEAKYRAAAEAGDYRIALRYGHLLLLQTLQHAALIRYRADKTNADYVAQMAGTAHVGAFRELARAYEYAWYGAYPTDAASFQAYDARLSGLQTKLS